MARKTVVLALGLILLGGSDTEAQVIVSPTGPGLGTETAPVMYSSAYIPPAAGTFAGETILPGRITSYSYYAVPDNLPPRLYAGYGASDLFPYFGQPYGNPYDRWTWSSMTGFPPSSLVRYYYPPVP